MFWIWLQNVELYPTIDYLIIFNRYDLVLLSVKFREVNDINNKDIQNIRRFLNIEEVSLSLNLFMLPGPV